MVAEGAWLEGLQRGDPAAFDAVYEAYRARVFSFVLRLGGERALAEDVMQDTFVRLAERAARLAPDTDLRAWLFTVARNRFLDRRRRMLFRGRTLSALPLAATTGPTPFDRLEQSELAARVQRALSALPADQREAVLLCSVEGFTPAEAASIAGVSPATLRKRLSRGRQALRKLIR